jgi:Calcineurin-like phosphoesterase
MKPNQRKRLVLGFLLCSIPSADAFSSTSSLRSLKPLTSFATKQSDDEPGKDDNDSPPKERKTIQDSQDDRSKKRSQSRDKAMSALSRSTENEVDLKQQAMSKLGQPPGSERLSRQSNRGNTKSGSKDKRESSLLPRAAVGFQKKGNPSGGRRSSPASPSSMTLTTPDDKTSFSLLPPPVKDSDSQTNSHPKDESLSAGLSSWVDFMGSGTPQPSGNNRAVTRKKTTESRGTGLFSESANSSTRDSSRDRSNNLKKRETSGLRSAKDDRLPAIADLFPPDYSITSSRTQGRSTGEDDGGSSGKTVSPPPTLDGVLPVSDLFYRSSQSMSEEEDLNRDDEELPFSAEQSDRLTTGNRIRVRRNQASVRSSKSDQRKKSSGTLKMVRRGMEMLVGGVPINADPPQRYVDLVYAHNEAESGRWHEVITMNTRDFGPLLHSSSVGAVSKVEQGLFCEHFVHYTNKWDVCPKDLRTIVKAFSNLGSTTDNTQEFKETDNDNLSSVDQEVREGDDSVGKTPAYASQEFGVLKSYSTSPMEIANDDEADMEANLGGELVFSIGVSREDLQSADSANEVPVLERVLAKGVAASTDCSGFSVVFTKLILTDLDDGTTQITGNFRLILKDDQSMSYGELQSKAHRISSSLAQATDEGNMQLAMAAAAREELAWPEALRNRIVEEFLFDDDEEDLTWENKKMESENASEYDQDEAEDIDKSLEYLKSDRGSQVIEDSGDGPFGMPGSVEYHKDDIFLGNGNDGVFWNYAEGSAEKSPFGGALGLRLVDSVIERAKQRQPRVIAIGDVHGCIDELQELLRRCDYRPGDLLIFLGDLVSKGPDSIAVVQMAREIGAIGVRGNHDFEVIRWHQAIKSGIDPPVVGSEHFHIASCLTKADMKWMYRYVGGILCAPALPCAAPNHLSHLQHYSLPWYISSRELGALFVHAGFVSGIRLAKQNPRLMMNMRSILPDGTVTSKFFNNWPWARLWDGPQTVLFGHDADRGLQQYEHAIGLDTGCVYGGRLTACILPEKRLVSVSARREYFKYRRKHYD